MHTGRRYQVLRHRCEHATSVTQVFSSQNDLGGLNMTQQLKNAFHCLNIRGATWLS